MITAVKKQRDEQMMLASVTSKEGRLRYDTQKLSLQKLGPGGWKEDGDTVGT
jgi:hypothetical protein